MTSRTLLSIILGVACSALAVGGLYWAGARDAGPPDAALDVSADARAAYVQGADPAPGPQLRAPDPAPVTEPAPQSAAPDPSPVEPAPPVRYDDHEAEGDEGDWYGRDHDEDDGDHHDEGEDD